jgi:hypothetical protein
MSDAQLTKKIREVEAGIMAIASQLSEGRARDMALRRGALILVEAMQRRVSVADRPVHRYSGGKIAATYYPGNLRRSIRILEHMKDKRAVYAGVLRNPASGSKGVFTGDRADGWYAHYVEYGPRKRPFVRPAIAEAGPQAIASVRSFVKTVLSRSGGSR